MRTDSPEPSLAAGAQEEWQRWRTRTLTALLRTTGIACSALGLFAAIQVRAFAFGALNAVAATLMFVAAAAGGRLSFRLRAAILLVGLHGGAAASLMLGGLSPNILVAMCVCVVMGSLLLGRAWGLVSVACAAGTVAVVVPLRNAGLLPTELHLSYEAPDTGTLLRVVIAFVLLSSAIVVSISYLLARAQDLFLQKARALETLEREQARRRQADDQLSSAQVALQKARELEVLGRLASSVAHDFNNALLIIQASAELARLRPSYAEKALRDIESAVAQGASTTRQLRAFCPQAQQPPRPLALGDTLTREADLLGRILPANVELRYERPPTDFLVLGDEGQIQSVLTNLALNARDAMPEGGTLALRLRAETAEEAAFAPGASFAVIEVEDTGLGMSAETAARIFEPFFTTKGASGTGLGLASVRAIVEKGGGRIEVASEVGRGTCFRVFWPLHVAQAERASEGEEEGKVAVGTVLVVDDDEDVRSAMTKPLAWRGYTVLEARTGADALVVARAHEGRIDVLCVDLVMPGMPARQLVDTFRAEHPGVRVLLCSGHLPEEGGRPLDVDAFLSKPFSPTVLAANVQALVVKAGGRAETGP